MPTNNKEFKIEKHTLPNTILKTPNMLKKPRSILISRMNI